MVKLVKADPTRYGAEEDKLWQTDKLLASLKGQLMDGLIFQVRIFFHYFGFALSFYLVYLSIVFILFFFFFFSLENRIVWNKSLISQAWWK